MPVSQTAQSARHFDEREGFGPSCSNSIPLVATVVVSYSVRPLRRPTDMTIIGSNVRAHRRRRQSHRRREVYRRSSRLPICSKPRCCAVHSPTQRSFRSIASKAAALPGVVAILTRDDLNDIDPYYGNCLRDRAVVATDKVRFVGEPVAVVAAESGLIAEASAGIDRRAISRTALCRRYRCARAEGAPLVARARVRRRRVSRCRRRRRNSSAAISAIANASSKAIRTEPSPTPMRSSTRLQSFPMIYQYAMEPHSAVARVNAAGITLWSSSAHPFLVRSELAHMFGYPHAKVEVIVPYVGGAYGSKSYFKIEPLAVAIARKTGGRPVRVVQSVTESMLTTRRHSARLRIKTGVKRDGTLVAREAEVFMDTGAYADNGPRVAKRVISRMLGPYKLDHCKIDVVAFYTNTVPAGSMRSIGGPQSIWALESHMDSIASHLGIDPLEFRMRHLLKRGEVLKPGATAIDADLRQGMQAAVAPLNWQNRSRSKSPRRWRGRRRVRFGSDAGFGGAGAFARRRQCHPPRRHAQKWGRGRGRFSARSSPRNCPCRSTASACVAPTH